MMMFWVIAALMTGLTVLILLRPLFRPQAVAASQRGDHDLAVYRDQLAELKRDQTRGLLTPAEAEALRAEIARRMLAIKDEQNVSISAVSTKTPRLALFLLFALPAAALALYLSLGSPDRPSQPFNPAAITPKPAAPPPQVQDAIARLETQLAQAPDNPGDWILLAQARSAMGNPSGAAEAYGKAHALRPDNTALSDSYAQALTQANDGIIPDEARKLFEASLARDPHDFGAAYALVEARLQAGDTQDAIAKLRALIADTPADAFYRPMLQKRLGELDPTAKP